MHDGKSDYEVRLELDLSEAEFYDNPLMSFVRPSEEDVIEAQTMSYYYELGATPEMEDELGSIIPPEDMTRCNDAEYCDDCKWNIVCFKED